MYVYIVLVQPTGRFMPSIFKFLVPMWRINTKISRNLFVGCLSISTCNCTNSHVLVHCCSSKILLGRHHSQFTLSCRERQYLATLVLTVPLLLEYLHSTLVPVQFSLRISQYLKRGVSCTGRIQKRFKIHHVQPRLLIQYRLCLGYRNGTEEQDSEPPRVHKYNHIVMCTLLVVLKFNNLLSLLVESSRSHTTQPYILIRKYR